MVLKCNATYAEGLVYIAEIDVMITSRLLTIAQIHTCIGGKEGESVQRRHCGWHLASR